MNTPLEAPSRNTDTRGEFSSDSSTDQVNWLVLPAPPCIQCRLSTLVWNPMTMLDEPVVTVLLCENVTCTKASRARVQSSTALTLLTVDPAMPPVLANKVCTCALS